MIANGSGRLWMGVALGSVLVVGVAAGLAAERLLAERDAPEASRQDRAQAHGDRPPPLHFDCRGWEESQAELSGGAEDSGVRESTGPSREAAADRTPAETPAHLDAADAASPELASALERHRSRFTERMKRRLDLDPEQVEALAAIVDEAMIRGRRYWAGARDAFCAMQRDFDSQVEELLRPDQALRFDEMRRDLWDRRPRQGTRDHDHDHDDDREGKRHGGRRDDGSPGECE